MFHFDIFNASLRPSASLHVQGFYTVLYLHHKRGTELNNVELFFFLNGNLWKVALICDRIIKDCFSFLTLTSSVEHLASPKRPLKDTRKCKCLTLKFINRCKWRIAIRRQAAKLQAYRKRSSCTRFIKLLFSCCSQSSSYCSLEHGENRAVGAITQCWRTGEEVRGAQNRRQCSKRRHETLLSDVMLFLCVCLQERDSQQNAEQLSIKTEIVCALGCKQIRVCFAPKYRASALKKK